MGSNGNAKGQQRQSKWILIGSIVLGALFTIFGFLSLSLPLVNFAYQEGLFNYDTLPVSVGIAVSAGLGLRRMVRRYNAPRVQAGTIVGAIVATALNLVYAWAEFSDEFATGGKVVLYITVGLVILYAAVRITANPDSESSEPNGASLIRRSIPGLGRSAVEDEPSSFGGTRKSMPNHASDTSEPISKRQLLMYLLTVGIGWFLGTFLNPLKQTVNDFLVTPLGAKPGIWVSFRTIGNDDEKVYWVSFSNSGGKPAEDFLAHIGFNEKITSFDSDQSDYFGPVLTPEIEINDKGIARVRINRLGVRDQNAPSTDVGFSVAEGTRSSTAQELEDDNGIFVSYRYSWTFQGERYYYATTYVCEYNECHTIASTG